MNSIFILYPERTSFGIWVFDDESTGLVREPFVGETNTLIDNMVGDIKAEGSPIALLFSASSFPNYQVKLELSNTSPSGTTYYSPKYKIFPWLCPAMFKYFPTAPEEMFACVVKGDNHD